MAQFLVCLARHGEARTLLGLAGVCAEQIGAFERDADVERAAFALFTFDPGVATVPLRDALDDEQAQAAAFDRLVLAAAYPAEALKEVLLVFLADAQAGVFDAQDQVVIAEAGADGDRAAV